MVVETPEQGDAFVLNSAAATLRNHLTALNLSRIDELKVAAALFASIVTETELSNQSYIEDFAEDMFRQMIDITRVDHYRPFKHFVS